MCFVRSLHFFFLSFATPFTGAILASSVVRTLWVKCRRVYALQITSPSLLMSVSDVKLLVSLSEEALHAVILECKPLFAAFVC